jgi:predicted transcriptional regulator
MAQSILEMAKDLVQAQIAARGLPPEDMQKELQKTYDSLLSLKRQEDTGSVAVVLERDEPPTRANWKQSIRRHTVTCLECGAQRKQLSVHHLQQHGLDLRSYRDKYGGIGGGRWKMAHGQFW